jgi:sugar phosphate isomerase/epimerase
MKLGMLTGLWYVAEGASVFESLRRAAALGFRYVDLHGVFHAGPAHLSLAERKEVRDELDRMGLTPRNYVLHARHNIASASPSEQDEDLAYLTEGLDLAVSWRINQLMLNAGQWDSGLPRDQAWWRAVRFLQHVCDRAADRGIFIGLEPEPYVWFLVNDLASCARMLDDVRRPNFGCLVDLGHMALAREGPADLTPLKGRIVHAHLSDHEPHRHTNQPIGTGFAPIGPYLQALHDLGVDQDGSRWGYDELVVSFELGVPGTPIDDVDGWVRISLENVRRVSPYMTMA